MKAHFDVVNIVDNDDGTANVTLEMGLETLKVFAAIGLMEVFKEKAREALDGHSDPEGAANSASGGEGANPLSGDFPGF